MIQTHAYDGWVRADQKTTTGYAVTRLLGAVPAPLFLLLAGVGLAWGAHAAEARGTPVADARRRFARRGLEVVGWGYVVSVVYAVIEWSFGASALLRADILHAIGLSLVATTFLFVGRTRPWLRAALVLPLAVALSVLAGRLLAGLRLPIGAAVPLALFVDVAPFTRFPLLPLVAFTAIGFAFGRTLLDHPPTAPRAAIGVLLGIATTFLLHQLVAPVLAWTGGELSRAHPAVVLNLLGGTARAVATICLAYATTHLVGPLRAPLVRLGRGSLLAYAFHVPFCYGRLARPFAHRLEMLEASALLVALVVLTWLAVRIRDAVRARPRA